MLTEGVTWFISGQRNRASSRLQGYLIHEHLVKTGFPSRLFLAPPFNIKDIPWAYENLEVVANSIQTPNVVLQKLYGERAERLIHLLRGRGLKTIFVECDYYPEKKTQYQCDEIVVTSKFLYEKFSKNGAVCSLIPDPLEEIIPRERLIKKYREKKNKGEIKLIWVGHRRHWHTLKPLNVVLAQPQFKHYRLITISSHPDADIRWKLNTVSDHIGKGDIGVVPVGSQTRYQAKSNNRLTLFMALGLPVVADSIPSYETIVENGQNGFLCQSREDWEYALSYLRNSVHRFDMARNAYESIVARFNLDQIVNLWLSVFRFDGKKGASIKNKHAIRSGEIRKYQAQLDVDLNLKWAVMAAKRRRWKKSFMFGGKATLKALSHKRAFTDYVHFLQKIKEKKAA